MKKIIFLSLLTVLIPQLSAAQILTPGYELTEDGFVSKEICRMTYEKGYAPQGMEVYKDHVISCRNRGAIHIFRFDGNTLEPVSNFLMESTHENNHSNVASFGPSFYDRKDPFPLLYVSQCAKQPAANGLKDVCFVERIMPDMQSSQLVQTIYYDDVNKDFGYALQWVVDKKNNMLYGYGNTTKDRDVEGNRHRIIKFRLPSLEDSDENGLVVLKPEDALENYLIEDYGFAFATIGQGLYIWKDVLYMPTGFGGKEFPSYLFCWNLKKKKMEKVLDLSKATYGELEDIGRWKNSFIIIGVEGAFTIKGI